MELDKYDVEISNSYATFDFISKGHLGKIDKVINYTEIDEGIYNLGFGDKNLVTGNVDDKVVTNNGDMTKILATVAYSIYVFTEKNPNIWIYVTGSSQSRIRLYRMAINKYFEELSQDFNIYISKGSEEWYFFEPNTKTTEFLIQRKNEK